MFSYISILWIQLARISEIYELQNQSIPGNIFTDHMYRWGRYQCSPSVCRRLNVCVCNPSPPPLSRNQNPDMWNLGWQQCVNWISKYTVNILNNSLFLFQIWPELVGSDSTLFVSWYLWKTADNWYWYWYLWETTDTSLKELYTSQKQLIPLWRSYIPLRNR